MNKEFENRLNELVESINGGMVTYNGLTLARGIWSYYWNERIGMNRLVLSCENPGCDAISRIAIRDVQSIEVVQQSKNSAAYIVSCEPNPRNRKAHVFNIEL